MPRNACFVHKNCPWPINNQLTATKDKENYEIIGLFGWKMTIDWSANPLIDSIQNNVFSSLLWELQTHSFML